VKAVRSIELAVSRALVRIAVCGWLWGGACSGGGPGASEVDATSPDAATDATAADASTDAAVTDAAVTDAAVTDAASPDAASPDAALPDAAATDAALPDAAATDASTDAFDSTSIVVRATDRVGYDGIAPSVGRRVVFVAPDGSVVDTVTDGAGVAVGPGISGTTVFVTRYVGLNHVMAFTAVEPGTVIEVAPPPTFRFSSYQPLAPVGFLFADVPSEPYQFYDMIYPSCGQWGSTRGFGNLVEIALRSDCTHKSDATAVALHRVNNGVSYDFAGWAIMTGVDFVALQNQIVPVPPLQAPLDMHLHHTSAPAGTILRPVVKMEGLDFELGFGGVSTTVTSSTVDQDILVAPVGPATIRTDVWYPQLDPQLLEWVAEEKPVTGLDVTIDLADPIARVTYPTVGPLFDVHWTWLGTHKADIVTARLDYTNALGYGAYLDLYGPGDRDSLTVPVWPAVLADALPQTQPGLEGITAYDVIGRDGYAAALVDAYFDRITLPLSIADTFYPDEERWRSSQWPCPDCPPPSF